MEGMAGEIQIFAFGFNPENWLPCNGQLIPVSQNAVLASLISNTYGGDGQITMAVPDLQGRIAIGAGDYSGGNFTLGQKGGSETIKLDSRTLPYHNHTFNPPRVMASSKNGTAAAPSATLNTLGAFYDTSISATNNAYNNETPNVPITTHGQTYTASTVGEGAPFNIMQPTLGLNYCICTMGLYPVRS